MRLALFTALLASVTNGLGVQQLLKNQLGEAPAELSVKQILNGFNDIN